MWCFESRLEFGMLLAQRSVIFTFLRLLNLWRGLLILDQIVRLVKRSSAVACSSPHSVFGLMKFKIPNYPASCWNLGEQSSVCGYLFDQSCDLGTVPNPILVQVHPVLPVGGKMNRRLETYEFSDDQIDGFARQTTTLASCWLRLDAVRIRSSTSGMRACNNSEIWAALGFTLGRPSHILLRILFYLYSEHTIEHVRFWVRPRDCVAACEIYKVNHVRVRLNWHVTYH